MTVSGPPDELYQEILLDHYRHPRCKRILPDEAAVVERHNSLCGDCVRVLLTCEQDRIVDVSFDGKGCAVSIASASIMAERVSNCSIAEASTLIATVMTMLNGGECPSAESGDLRALSPIASFPMRIKCATLGWAALQDALAREGDKHE